MGSHLALAKSPQCFEDTGSLKYADEAPHDQAEIRKLPNDEDAHLQSVVFQMDRSTACAMLGYCRISQAHHGHGMPTISGY